MYFMWDPFPFLQFRGETYYGYEPLRVAMSGLPLTSHIVVEDLRQRLIEEVTLGHFTDLLFLSLDRDGLLIPALACCNKASKSDTALFSFPDELFIFDIESSCWLKCLELSLGLRLGSRGAESATNTEFISVVLGQNKIWH